MSGAATCDAAQQGSEVISVTMMPMLIVCGSLFAHWMQVVKPRNLLLLHCALEHKITSCEEEQVNNLRNKTAMGGALLAGSVLAGPHVVRLFSKQGP